MTDKENKTEEKAEEKQSKEIKEQSKPVSQDTTKDILFKKDQNDAVIESGKKIKNVNPKPEESISKEKTIQKKGKKQIQETKKSETKQDDKDENFQYIVRIANTDIDGEKKLIMGVAQIKGIGRQLASLIVESSGLDKKLKIGVLTEQQIEKLKNTIEDIEGIAPGWMLNHRKDIDTGKDIHLISSDVDLRLRDDINLLKMIRSYRGIRHETGLPVRGQRTRANNRRGLSLGVSKKKGA